MAGRAACRHGAHVVYKIDRLSRSLMDFAKLVEVMDAHGVTFAPELTEAETLDALHRLDPLWEHLFPAEQARIVRSLVERVVVGPAGADIRLRLDGLGSLVRDLGAIVPDALRAAA